MPRETYHHGDLRQALIHGTLELIAEKDVSSVSLREVARRVGVSHTAPYRHFEDKEALLAAVAEEGFFGLTQSMLSSIEKVSGSPLLSLSACGVGYVQYAIAQPSHYRVMFGAYRCDPSKYKSLAKAGEKAFMVLVNLIAEGQAAGIVKDGDARQLAWVNWSLVHGLAMLLIDGQIPVSQFKEKSTLANFVTHTLIEGIAVKDRGKKE